MENSHVLPHVEMSHVVLEHMLFWNTCCFGTHVVLEHMLFWNTCDLTTCDRPITCENYPDMRFQMLTYHMWIPHIVIHMCFNAHVKVSHVIPTTCEGLMSLSTWTFSFAMLPLQDCRCESSRGPFAHLAFCNGPLVSCQPVFPAVLFFPHVDMSHVNVLRW